VAQASRSWRWARLR